MAPHSEQMNDLSAIKSATFLHTSPERASSIRTVPSPHESIHGAVHTDRMPFPFGAIATRNGLSHASAHLGTDLFIDFHGAYKPTGLHRTYPNVLNHEGVYGLEQAKWDNESDLVTNEVTIPFIRMVAGPMDYTQGAMKNANKNNFAAIYTEPMSQGTRCRQLAEYVIFESPFNMLCDSPSNYMKEEECTQFIASVPTTWDETIVLDGKVGEYLVIARRKDFHWYVGAITNWEERDIEIDLSMLPNFSAKSGHIFRDGINANRVAKDYVSEQAQVWGNKVKVHLAKGGGAVMVF
jgi:alpha-glucosidase